MMAASAPGGSDERTREQAVEPSRRREPRGGERGRAVRPDRLWRPPGDGTTATTSQPLAACGGNVDILEVQISGADGQIIQPYRITAGPDGNLWVTEVWANSIARLTVDWRRDSFPLPGARKVQGIAPGPDGNVWFAAAGDQNGAIGRITPDGQITEFPLPDRPSPGNRWPSSIMAGPDGNIWFTDPTGNAIGSIGVDGVLRVDEFLPSTADWRDQPESLALAADGNFWFEEVTRFGRLTPAGAATFFPLPVVTGAAGGSGVNVISGPDGALWSNGPQPGSLRRVSLPDAGAAKLKIDELVPPHYDMYTDGGFGALTVGPDGNIWFAGDAKLGCATPAGLFHYVPLPSGASASDMTLGPDGALWFTEATDDRVGRISFR
jgi:streptogramin lyase